MENKKFQRKKYESSSKLLVGLSLISFAFAIMALTTALLLQI